MSFEQTKWVGMNGELVPWASANTHVSAHALHYGSGVFSEGRLLTNDERHSILLGITRDAVLQIARDLGYEVEIRMVELDDLLCADEAFFTGTAAEVTPISEVDEKMIGNGARGPVTRKIQEVFFDATSSRDHRYAHWLHRVRTCANETAFFTAEDPEVFAEAP